MNRWNQHPGSPLQIAEMFFVDTLTADISTVLCDKQNKAEMLLQNRETEQTPVLKTIVIMDSFDSELVDRGAKCGVDILSWEAVEVRQMEPINDLNNNNNNNKLYLYSTFHTKK